MANLKKKLSLLVGLCALMLVCLSTLPAAAAEAAPATYPCFVSVEGVGTVNGGTALETPAFSEVILSAPAENEGQSFLYWRNAETGLIVSGNRRTAVRVYDHTVYEAVYGDETEVVADAFVLVTDEGVSLYSYRYVPDGYTVVSYGVLYSTLKTPADLSDKTLEDVGTPGVKKAEKSTSSARVGSVYYTVTAPSFTYRPFVTVANEAGEVETVYGDAAEYTPCDEHSNETYKYTASCVTDGEEYLRCSVCKKHTVLEVNKEDAAHDFSVPVPEKQPTCTEDGYSAHTKCKLCSAVEGKATEGYESEGHQWEDIPEQPATCGAPGYSAHKKCSVCRETEGKEDYAALEHSFGDSYHLDSTYTENGCNARTCGNCGYVEKTYIESEPRLSYTFDVNQSAKDFSFTVTVSDAGLYEIAFNITTLPAASGYTSVYATNGRGSTLRIGGTDADSDGYSLYRFYVYLDKGENTVNVKGQGTMTVASAKLSFITYVENTMTQSFESITELVKDTTYPLPNGTIVIGSASQGRNIRQGVLQLRTGDTLSFTLTVSATAARRLAFVCSNANYTLTLTKGDETLTLGSDDFVSANAETKLAGTESAPLYLSKNELPLSAGEYTVKLTATNNVVIGGFYFSGEAEGHDHDFSIDVEEKASSCFENGYTAHKECSVCHAKDADYQLKELDETLHDFSIEVEEKPASCSEKGYTAHKECSICEAKNEEYQVIDEKHDFSVPVPEKRATCKEAGYKAYVKCSGCDATETAVEELPIDPDGHDFSIDVEEKASTCFEEGYTAHKKCSYCDAKNEDYQVTEPNEALHDFSVDVEKKDPSCYKKGYTAHKKCSICEAKNEDYQEIEADETLHNFSIDIPEKPATCMAKGHSAYKACSVCGAKNEEYAEYPATPSGHDWETVAERKSSCLEEGHNEHKLCKLCGYSPDKFILPKSEHSYGERYSVAATYKSGAYTAQRCETCNDVKKTFKADSEKLLFVGSNISHSGKTVSFNLKVPAAGVYELSFKYDTLPAIENYTVVYAVNGKGSQNRIGAETEENGDSKYKFYVYLEDGDNTVTMYAQAELKVSRVTAGYVTAAAASYVEDLSAVSELEAGKEKPVPNGKLTVSSSTGTRSVRNGILQLRTDDKLTFTYEASADGAYTMAIIASSKEKDSPNPYTITIMKGETTVATLYESHFEEANAEGLTLGTESARLFLLKSPLTLASGEYTVTLKVTGKNLILGATYITAETHTCDFSVDVPAISANCLSAGHDSYKACSICGEPEGAVVGTPKDTTAHAWVNVPGKQPTCVEGGYAAYKVCSVCGEIDGYEEKEADPTAHAWENVEEKPATCTEGGHSAYKHCGLCNTDEGKVTEGYESEGHQWEDIPEQPATCGAPGYSAHKKCSVCGETEGKEDYSALTHALGESYHVAATYKEGGYNAKDCGNCDYVEKTYIESEPKLSYTFDVNQSAKDFPFTVTVSDAGLYEIAFKITAYPTASGYTSVYAALGKGSALRIEGTDADSDGYSLYRFYVYLDKGENTVNVKGQGTMTVASARLTFVTDTNEAMTQTFESITALVKNTSYTLPNGTIVTGSASQGRNIRQGVLQLRTGDTVTFTLNISETDAYDMSFITSNAAYTLTLTKGDETLTLGPADFVQANGAVNMKASESTTLFSAKNELQLSAGTYTVTVNATGNFILGGIYFSSIE